MSESFLLGIFKRESFMYNTNRYKPFKTSLHIVEEWLLFAYLKLSCTLENFLQFKVVWYNGGCLSVYMYRERSSFSLSLVCILGRIALWSVCTVEWHIYNILVVLCQLLLSTLYVFTNACLSNVGAKRKWKHFRNSWSSSFTFAIEEGRVCTGSRDARVRGGMYRNRNHQFLMISYSLSVY